MKVTSFFSLTMLTLILTISCTSKKQLSVEEQNRIPVMPVELEKAPLPATENSDVVTLQSLKLPSEKKVVEVNQQTEKNKNRYQPIPDKYGNVNDYRTIPSYDINNLPISVWFIKDDNKFIGFIVAGHATKAVCEVASLEVYNKLKAIGKDDATIFSFGVGYNLKKSHASDNVYNGLLADMKTEFEDLASKYPTQVKIGIIDINNYESYLSQLKSHINLANNFNEWTTHIVEYKLENFPLIAPFHYTESSDIIQIRIPKSKFGDIPTELVYASYEKSLSDGEDDLKSKIQGNQLALDAIQDYSDPHSSKTVTINYWTIEGDYFLKKMEDLRGHEPPPDGYYLESGDGSRTPLTFKQAQKHLNAPYVIVTPQARSSLEFWIKQAQEDMKKFRKQRKVLREKVNNGNLELKKRLKEINKRRAELRNRDNQDYIIDAFLRGWVFETSNISMNDKLDKWYANYRKSVWNYLLDQVPNSRAGDLLGGIFHSDDVFFQVNTSGNNFIITPYKVVGGEFIQVIDKELGISYLQSPFNFRFNK